jgi:hypothetical protein
MASGSRSPDDVSARQAADNFDIYNDYDFSYNTPVFVSRAKHFTDDLTKKQKKLDDWIRLLVLRHSAYRIRAANGSREFEQLFKGLDLSRPLDSNLFFGESEIDGIDEPLQEPGSHEAYIQICRFMQISQRLAEERVSVANQLEDYLVRERMKVNPWVEELNAAEDRERAANDMSPRGEGLTPPEEAAPSSATKRKRGKKDKAPTRKDALSTQLREYAEGFVAEYAGIAMSDLAKTVMEEAKSVTASESTK